MDVSLETNLLVICCWLLLLLGGAAIFSSLVFQFGAVRRISLDNREKNDRFVVEQSVLKEAAATWESRGRDRLANFERAMYQLGRRRAVRSGVSWSSPRLLWYVVISVAVVFVFQTAVLVVYNYYGVFSSEKIPVFEVIVDVASRGALFDFMESYDFKISDFEPVQNEGLFSTYQFVFRSAWGAVIPLIVASFPAVRSDLRLRSFNAKYLNPDQISEISEIAKATHPADFSQEDHDAIDELRNELGYPSS